MKKILGIIVSAFLIFSVNTSVVFAQNDNMFPFRQGETVVLEEGEVIERDFFATGENVEIKGTINGDLYIAGGSVVVAGTVHGDVLAVGGQVDITGNVGGNVRAIGGNIEVYGNVGKNLTIAGGNIEVHEKAMIGGSAVFGAGNVDLVGPVSGNIIGGVGNLTMSNSVGGNVYAGVGQLQLKNGVNIAGDVVYWSEDQAMVDTEATISGLVDYRKPVQPQGENAKEAMQSVWTGFRIVSLFSMAIIGLLVLRFFPGVIEAGAGIIDKRSWTSLGFGFLKLILAPIAAVILMITIIGFPLGIFLIFFYIMELYFASYFVVYWLGKLIWSKFNKTENVYWAFLIGTLAFIIVTSIPVFGGIIRFASLLFGLGSILLLKYSWYQKTFAKKK